MNLHIIRTTRGTWAVKTQGTTRALRVFKTQAQALEYGREVAQRSGARVVVHAADGTMRRMPR